MAVLVQDARPASERVVGVADLGAVREALLQDAPEGVAVETRDESVLVRVGDRESALVVGDIKGRQDVRPVLSDDPRLTPTTPGATARRGSRRGATAR